MAQPWFLPTRGVLFHQNMRKYGGGQNNRNAAYSAAFQTIRANLNPVPVLIAGFTELANNAGAVAALSNFGPCAALGVGPAQAVLTRETAPQRQGRRRPTDYTGIAVAAGVDILSWGRVVPYIDIGSLLIHDVFAPDVLNPPNGTRTIQWPDPARQPQLTPTTLPAWAANLPAQATLDYQSLVYVVANIGGGLVVAVAFLHNIFLINDNKSLILQKLPAAASLIAQNPAMPPGAGVVYTCGDFNAAPRDVSGRFGRTGLRTQPFSQETVGPGQAAPLPWSLHAILTNAQVGAGYTAGGTTAAGNLYDYSFCSVTDPVPQWHQGPWPAIDVVTLDNGGQGPNGPLSDHAASLLFI